MTDRNYWPLGIVLGLGFVVVTNVGMVVIAAQNPQTLETSDAWKDGQAYQAVLDAREAQARQGWRVELIVAKKEVWLKVLDREGAPLSGLSGRVRATRADTRALDYEADLKLVEPGVYKAILHLPKSGLWRLDTTLTGEDGRWFDERKIQVGAS